MDIEPLSVIEILLLLLQDFAFLGHDLTQLFSSECYPKIKNLCSKVAKEKLRQFNHQVNEIQIRPPKLYGKNNTDNNDNQDIHKDHPKRLSSLSIATCGAI